VVLVSDGTDIENILKAHLHERNISISDLEKDHNFFIVALEMYTKVDISNVEVEVQLYTNDQPFLFDDFISGKFKTKKTKKMEKLCIELNPMRTASETIKEVANYKPKSDLYTYKTSYRATLLFYNPNANSILYHKISRPLQYSGGGRSRCKSPVKRKKGEPQTYLSLSFSQILKV